LTARVSVSDSIGEAAKAKLANNPLAGINLVAGAEALAHFRETLRRGWSELDDAAVLKTYQDRG
jgi:hypothetical protein